MVGCNGVLRSENSRRRVYRILHKLGYGNIYVATEFAY